MDESTPELETVTLEVKMGEVSYKFICPTSAPLGEIHDVLTRLKTYIVDRIRQADIPEFKKAEDEISVLPVED
jgi:hypothetical protein